MRRTAKLAVEARAFAPAPVYKLHYLTATELTFVLTSAADEMRLETDARRAVAPDFPGPWWHAWLRSRSGRLVAPPAMASTGRRTVAAPGHYVLEK